MLKSKKKMSIDNYRHNLQNILKNYELKSNPKDKKFYLFLHKDDFNQFEHWFDICSAKENFEENILKLKKIIDVFNKSKNLISFKRLFEIDRIWYEFFCQNADINGNIHPNESRYGVDKNYIYDILIIKKLTLNDEIKESIDMSIMFYQQLKFIFFNI